MPRSAAWSRSLPRNWPRARCSRDITVPTGQRMMSATSR
jgi:hypothetical protein